MKSCCVYVIFFKVLLCSSLVHHYRTRQKCGRNLTPRPRRRKVATALRLCDTVTHHVTPATKYPTLLAILHIDFFLQFLRFRKLKYKLDKYYVDFLVILRPFGAYSNIYNYDFLVILRPFWAYSNIYNYYSFFFYF